jgi:hypothetical protein
MFCCLQGPPYASTHRTAFCFLYFVTLLVVGKFCTKLCVYIRTRKKNQCKFINAECSSDVRLNCVRHFTPPSIIECYGD